LFAGRQLTEGDRIGTEPVAVVNQAFAQRFLGGANPIDHFITLPNLMVQPRPNVPIRIVGVVADVVYVSLRETPQATMYLPIAQHDEPGFIRALATVHLNVSAMAGPPAGLAKAVAASIERVHPGLSVTFRPLQDQIDDSLARERVMALLASFFGGVALLLAALGLYGVAAYAVARRRIEIGIRMALGAAPARVVRLMLSRVTVMVATGIVAGVGLSLWMSTFVASLLFGLAPRDPMTMTGAVGLLVAIGCFAGWLPAYRASRIDPAEVLRES
jgi:ABC-type antimicrobial peptide transport system permease subunit